jgi:hypothetical protein
MHFMLKPAFIFSRHYQAAQTPCDQFNIAPGNLMDSHDIQNQSHNFHHPALHPD